MTVPQHAKAAVDFAPSRIKLTLIAAAPKAWHKITPGTKATASAKMEKAAFDWKTLERLNAMQPRLPSCSQPTNHPPPAPTNHNLDHMTRRAHGNHKNPPVPPRRTSSSSSFPTHLRARRTIPAPATNLPARSPARAKSVQAAVGVFHPRTHHRGVVRRAKIRSAVVWAASGAPHTHTCYVLRARASRSSSRCESEEVVGLVHHSHLHHFFSFDSRAVRWVGWIPSVRRGIRLRQET